MPAALSVNSRVRLEKPAIGDPCNGCGLCCQMQVCSTGSYVLGLVDNYGDRARGPCPALLPKGDGFTCGLVARPKDYVDSPRGVTVLRNAAMLLIGAGIGCDEAGDEPDETALPKLDRLQETFLGRHSRREIDAAVRALILGE